MAQVRKVVDWECWICCCGCKQHTHGTSYRYGLCPMRFATATCASSFGAALDAARTEAGMHPIEDIP
jgi:hypothetical protein